MDEQPNTQPVQELIPQPLPQQAQVNIAPPVNNKQQVKKPYKKILLIIFGVILLLIILVVGFLFFNTKTSILKQVNQGQVGILTSSPEQTTLKITSDKSAPTEANIIINSGEQKITSANLAVWYDTNSIKDVEILEGDFLSFEGSTITKNIDTSTGTINFSIQAPKGSFKSGQGILATISFTPVSEAIKNTKITFLPQTSVTAQGYSKSVLRTTFDGQLNLTKTTLESTDLTK